MTIAETIQALGGVTAVGKACRVHPSAVCHWKRRDLIPARHWHALITMAVERECPITAESLVEAHKR